MEQLDKVLKLIEINAFVMRRVDAYRDVINNAKFETEDLANSFVAIQKVYTQYAADTENMIIAEIGKICPKNNTKPPNPITFEGCNVIEFPQK